MSDRTNVFLKKNKQITSSSQSFKLNADTLKPYELSMGQVNMFENVVDIQKHEQHVTLNKCETSGESEGRRYIWAIKAEKIFGVWRLGEAERGGEADKVEWQQGVGVDGVWHVLGHTCSLSNHVTLIPSQMHRYVYAWMHSFFLRHTLGMKGNKKWSRRKERRYGGAEDDGLGT